MLRSAGILVSLALLGVGARADDLTQGFEHPPPAARPRVWWHWMNGNISTAGIQRDLEWMKRVGIGGVQNFDADLGTPQMVDRRLPFMSPEWRDAFRYAAGLANSLGLEMAIASSPGWSETGGPWVTASQAMKKLVWSETLLAGGVKLAKLTPPPTVAGPYQNIPSGEEGGGLPHYYVDTKVLAFRAPADRINDLQAPVAKISSNVDATLGLLIDGDESNAVSLPFGVDNRASVRFDYPTVQTVQSAVVAMPGGKSFGAPPEPHVWLEASDERGSFHRVVELTPSAGQLRTATFPPVSARSFRFAFEAVPGPRLGQEVGAPGSVGFPFPPAPRSFRVSEISLFRRAQVHHFDEKAGFGAAPDYYSLATPPVGKSSVVLRSGVLDLTARLRTDGTLDWVAPKGTWVVLRFGYTLTGHRNHPATPEGTGLESDKLNADHVRAYLDHYLDLYADTTGPDLIGRQGLTALLNDSIESGPQNWTDDFVAEFKRLRGYDPVSWMPALTGVIVDDAQASDRFLWDFRRTISDLLTEAHYRTVAEVARQRGLTVYGEALESGRPQLGDDIAMRKYTTIPMAAMWTLTDSNAQRARFWADDVGAASVAHVYGQNLTAAESLTSGGMPWAHAPRHLKSTVDLEFAYGINRLVIHTSVHQPLLYARPGLALAVQLGQYFNRNETWAEMADAWVNYLARSSYLLQQGRFVADVAYFVGEEAPLTALFAAGPPKDFPTHYGADFINADILQNELTVQGGSLVTRTGMRYRVLYLGGSSRRMTLPTLRHVAKLVRDGATVVGERPVDSPSGSDDPREFLTLVNALWGTPVNDSTITDATVRVIAGKNAEEALLDRGVSRDVDFGDNRDILTVHRQLADGEIYFVNNRLAVAQDVDAKFRVTDRLPEIWHADSGSREATGFEQVDGVTRVRLHLEPQGAIFVVFREPTTERSRSYPKSLERTLQTMTGPWTLSFESRLGAPETTLTVPTLELWNRSPDPRVRYFSGIGTYRASLKAPSAWSRSGRRIVLDLGEVNDLAEVWVNGNRAGVAWHAPFRVDVSECLHFGNNDIEIRVANRWVNRLIGDAQPGATKYTVTQGPTYNPDAPLVPAGLAGPVRVLAIER